jgi:hypothetical protein
VPAIRFFNGTFLLELLLIFGGSIHSLPVAPPHSTPPVSIHTQALPSQSAASREAYVGDAACGSCHAAIHRTYLQTTHHLSSQLPTAHSIAGKFIEGSNTLKTFDPNLHFTMTAHDGAYYQSAVFWQPPDQQTKTERMDIVIGSGQRGQTYLYWKGDRLFELPVSYWTPLSEWVNSPGYTDGTADFNRPVDARCLECHTGYFASLPSNPPENRFRKTGFDLSISCERCHGPGRQHVAFEKSRSAQTQQSQPQAASDKSSADNFGIVNPDALPRDRQVEVCAQCHGGLGALRTAAYTYVPGRPLGDYLELALPDPQGKVDVHGNQVALLERSRCYQSSSKMSCTTCHDVHAPEREAAAYSDRCLTCHQPQNCGEYPKLGSTIAQNCIDCHMPVQESDLIVSNVAGQKIKMRIRNHWIKAYPAQ